jgi:hypothetical protein
LMYVYLAFPEYFLSSRILAQPSEQRWHGRFDSVQNFQVRKAFSVWSFTISKFL